MICDCQWCKLLDIENKPNYYIEARKGYFVKEGHQFHSLIKFCAIAQPTHIEIGDKIITLIEYNRMMELHKYEG